MNLTLMKKVAGQWVYRSPDQYEIVQLCEEALQWNLYGFDCWLFDDAHWSMYTTSRQRMIASREDVARGYPALKADRDEVVRLLARHCVNVWRYTRKARLASHAAIADMKLAYMTARCLKTRPISKDGTRRNSIEPGAASYGQTVREG